MLSKASSFPVTTKAPRSLLRPAAPWNCDSLLKLGLWPLWMHLLPMASYLQGKGSLVGPPPSRVVPREVLFPVP